MQLNAYTKHQIQLYSHFKLKFIDEGNWRNDYPDEDDLCPDSSQDRKYYEDYGFDSGELTSKACVVKMIKVYLVCVRFVCPFL